MIVGPILVDPSDLIATWTSGLWASQMPHGRRISAMFVVGGGSIGVPSGRLDAVVSSYSKGTI